MDLSKTSFVHPCRSCGACCSSFRVSFHWSETFPESHGVPLELTTEVSHNVSAMKYSDRKTFRCIALEGEVGNQVSCRIYQNRPTACRDFKASYEDGTQNPRCDDTRASKGLSPLRPEDWV